MSVINSVILLSCPSKVKVNLIPSLRQGKTSTDYYKIITQP